MTTTETEIEKEKKDIAKHKEQHLGTRTTGGGIARLEIKSFGELENLAVILGKSDIVPKDMIGKPANILLALMFGNELGLTPAQALQNIMVVNGRPCLWGDATMGLVMASNVYEDSVDSFDPAVEGGTVTFKVKRRGKEWLTRTFSMKDAAIAKLDKKEGPWQTYPKRMLFHRARSWALRDTFPDVLKGIRYYEEERDIIDTTAETVTKHYAMPGEKVEPKVEAATVPATAAPAQAPAPDGKEETFRCGSGATTDFDGDPDCYVIKDDQDPPTKYYHKNPEWHAMAKAAKNAKAFLTAVWVEKKVGERTNRWVTALSLKS